MTRYASAVPLLWAAGFTGALTIALAPQVWPLIDLVQSFALADALSWHETLSESFSNGLGRTEQFRPFQRLLVKGLYEIAGLRLWFYKGLVLVQFLAILAVLVWILRPSGWRRSMAAVVALCCISGLPSTHILINVMAPNHYSLVTLLLLITAALALEPRMRGPVAWAFLPSTLLGVLFLELGALAPAILTALWLARAPGVDRRGVGASWLAIAIYAGLRLTLADQTGALQYGAVESNYGFSRLSPAQYDELFGQAPYLFTIYNVTASALTVLFSEPRAGQYQFVESLLLGNTPLWMWFHVISSTITTMVVASLVVLRRQCSSRDLQLTVFGLTLIVGGSALGFLYTRDRISVLVGLGYSVLLYVALAVLWERWAQNKRNQLLVGTAVVVLASTWTVRNGETWLHLQDQAWEVHVEWTDRYDELTSARFGELRTDIQGRPQSGPIVIDSLKLYLHQVHLLKYLRAFALANPPDDPRNHPPWTFHIFEREHSR